MKKLFVAALLCTLFNSYGQLAVRTDKKEVLDTFRATETIFILSNVYDTQTYEEVLKQSWTITPFRVIKLEDFHPMDFLDGKHSFAMLDANSVTTKSATYVHSFIAFFMFNMEDKLEEIEKVKKKSDKKKKDYDIMREGRIVIADILMCQNEEFIRTGSGNIQGAGEAMYQGNLFHNYTPGFLKNYFQKVNSLITESKTMGMYGGSCLPEIKALKKATLYVPEYIGLKYNAFKVKESEKTEEEKNELFKDYKYKYEYINADELSKKIMAGEELYYLRYVLENAQKYLQVVNSKTGEVVYKNYHPMGYKLKPDNMKEIKKAIDTGKL